jgi:hypothetical protein
MVDAAARSPGRLLVFVHIPKTAGTTLRTVLGMNEPGARSRALGNVFKGGGGISKSLIDRLRKDKGPDLSGVGLIRGHFPLGIREHLPRYLPRGREVACFTFLREPADRTLSHYFAIREHGRGYQLPPLPAEATVEDALERGYIHDNVQTRMLSGLAEPFGEVDQEMLERAKDNLREELVFFGLTERFDESLVLAKRRLGFRSILYKTSGRVNVNRARGDEVPAELREAAQACNRYDIELYRYAEQLFETAPERQELEFDAELAALRAAKANGDGESTSISVPASYGGDEQAWTMLVEARAELLRLEFERRRHRVPHVAATVQDEVRESELKAARTRTKKLEQEVERLKTAQAKTKRLEQQVERLKAASSRVEELEREVERLNAVASRAEELEQRLEQQVEHLNAASAKTEKFEQQVERLKAARSRNRKLQQEVERLKTAVARTEELEEEVQRLETAAAKAEGLEEEVERLKTAASRAEELEHELEQQLKLLDAARSRKTKLEQKVERLRDAAAVRE